MFYIGRCQSRLAERSAKQPRIRNTVPMAIITRPPLVPVVASGLSTTSVAVDDGLEVLDVVVAGALEVVLVSSGEVVVVVVP